MSHQHADRPHHILQVSAAISGGADRVAWNLSQAYAARGLRSRLVVGFHQGTASGASLPERGLPTRQSAHRQQSAAAIELMPHAQNGGLWSRAWWTLARRLEATGRNANWARRVAQPANIVDWLRGREQMNFPGTWRLFEMESQPPDVLHCHNLHLNYFDLRALPVFSQRVPLVITLHDAWLLSGHCAHSLGCERWMHGCGQCPDLSLYPPLRRDATAYNWQRKRTIFAQSRLFVVTPSRWLMGKVEQSMLLPGVVGARVIPNGVDLGVFHPGDQGQARHALGIPADASMLLFAANSIRSNPWKDYQTLQAAISAVAERTETPLLLVALGESAPAEAIGRAEVRFIPYTADQQQVARYYQAADVYVHATRADTFPNTVLEALACGIPVVATAVGGIPEQVEDGVTGFLTPPGDVDSLVGRILLLLQNRELRKTFARTAAEIAAGRFDLSHQVDEYLAFYAEARRLAYGALENEN